MTSPVSLSINGRIYDGFVSGSVTLTMEEACNNFSVEYLADGTAPAVRSIFPGDACEVAIDAGKGREVLIEGYVDTTEDDDEAESIRLIAAGRSKPEDLVDCAAIRKSWSKVTIDQLVADLCAPHGIGSFVATPGAAFESFSVQADETGIDTIGRAAMKRGLYPYSVGGDLVLARAGEYRTKTVLERGRNIVWSRRSDSWYSRYSDYVFRGQVRPTDNNWGKSANQLSTTVKDERITRFRPLRIQAEAHDGLDLKTRAELERNQRAGRSERIVCLVDEWLTDEGTAFRPNTLVRYRNPVFAVDATMLITVARFRFGPNEPRGVELELCRPEAFDLGKYPALGRAEAWT